MQKLFPKFLHKKEKPERAATVSTSPPTATDSDQAHPPIDVSDTASAPEPNAAVPTPTTFKNAVLFATKIAGNVSVPWVKIITESVLQVTQRLDTMKLNAAASRSLEQDIEAFLYIVARSVALLPDDQVVEQVKRRIEDVGDKIPQTQKSVAGFLNVEDTKDIIAVLKQNLDGAVQLLQTGLQIAQIQKMDEFKEWKTGIEESGSGDMVKKILNVTYTVGGNLSMNTKGMGNVSLAMDQVKIDTHQTYKQHTEGSRVNETIANSFFKADGDMEISAIAIGDQASRTSG